MRSCVARRSPSRFTRRRSSAPERSRLSVRRRQLGFGGVRPGVRPATPCGRTPENTWNLNEPHKGLELKSADRLTAHRCWHDDDTLFFPSTWEVRVLVDGFCHSAGGSVALASTLPWAELSPRGFSATTREREVTGVRVHGKRVTDVLYISGVSRGKCGRWDLTCELSQALEARTCSFVDRLDPGVTGVLSQADVKGNSIKATLSKAIRQSDQSTERARDRERDKRHDKTQLV